jgi:hypothetical protein
MTGRIILTMKNSMKLIGLMIFIINFIPFKCEIFCDINYRFNATNQKCEYYACSSDHDCQDFDYSRICVNQKCVCPRDYIEHKSSNKKCVWRKPIAKYCNKLGDCGLNQFCVDNVCECQPGYEYDIQTKSCELKPCNLFYCDIFDNNRHCTARFFQNNTSIHECKCKWGFSVDPNTKFCNLTANMSCTYNFDCIQYSDKMVCVDNICQCEPNYKKNDDSNDCNYYYCKNDFECQQYDEHRICEQNKCRCDDEYSEDSYNKKCYKFNWLWLLLILPILILFIVVFIVYRKYFSRSQHSNEDIGSPPTYTEIPLSIISQNFPIHDPPPPYFTNFSNTYHSNNINRSPEHIQRNEIESNHSENIEDPPPPYSIK